MHSIRLAVLLLAGVLAGCANVNSIYRPLDLGGGASGVAVDAKQRAIFSVPTYVKINDVTIEKSAVICAEPSPDALSAYSASGGLTAMFQTPGATTENQLQAAFAAGENAGSIGLRTQSIQLLRDGLFSNCLGFMNKAVSPEGFFELQRRSQNFTLGLLAIEQLTGVVKADQLALRTSAAAGTGTDDTEQQAAALDAAQKKQNDEKTALAQAQLAVKNARSAVTAQEAEVIAAVKKRKELKDPDDAAKQEADEAIKTANAALDPLKKDLEDKAILAESARRSVANADSQVLAAQESLTTAQMRVRAAASGTAEFVRSGGNRAAITKEVVTAVSNIVKTVLDSSMDEACWTSITRILGLPKGDVANDPMLPMVVARCDKKAVTALAEQVAKKPGAATPQLRRAFPQVEQFIAQ